ncbi:MAG: hypothetical protein OEV44_04795 [Spirochaetota bacterium]|nr:hypothetical protein [Spirochaetota bacterium]
MTKEQVMNELSNLSVEERLSIVESLTHDLKSEIMMSQLKRQSNEERRKRLSEGAKIMLNDYLNDKELTALTALDHEDFHG